MLKTLVKRSFARAWRKLEDDERINKRIALVEVERSSRPEFGDFSSGIALAEAKNTTLSAHELATQFANALLQILLFFFLYQSYNLYILYYRFLRLVLLPSLSPI